MTIAENYIIALVKVGRKIHAKPSQHLMVNKSVDYFMSI